MSSASPEREQQQQQAEGGDARGPSLRHLLDESKESLLEAERAFLSKALQLLEVIGMLLCPFHKLQGHVHVEIYKEGTPRLKRGGADDTKIG